MNILSFSNRLYKKLLLGLVVWALLVLSFVSISVSITRHLDSNALTLSQFAQLNMEIYHTAAFSTQMEALEHQADYDTSIPHRLDQIEHNLWACCTMSLRYRQVGTGELLGSQINRFLHTVRNQNLTQEQRSTQLFQQMNQINVLIKSYMQVIEEKNRQGIAWLRLIRLGLIGLILCSVAICFFLLKQIILRPLGLINQGILRIKQGELATRIKLNTHDEFDKVAEGFNQMADNLEEIYAHLEDKVEQRTLALARQKADWEILYQVTAYLHENTLGAEVLESFLQRMKTISQASAGCIYLEQNKQAVLHLRQGLSDDLYAQLHAWVVSNYASMVRDKKKIVDLNFQHNRQEQVLRPEQIQVQGLAQDLKQVSEQEQGLSSRVLLIPAMYLKQLKGLVVLQIDQDNVLNSNDIQLMSLLCSQLVIAKAHEDFNVKQKQYAVLEERNLIAQHLHDSIAQSLSFLNIQFQLLMKQKEVLMTPEIGKNIQWIQEGIQYCYDDVRELLSNFRTRIAYDNFQQAIEVFISRYQKKINIPIHLYILSDELNLSDEQKIQVIFILQEALSNIAKHAQAKEITVLIDDDLDFTMTIEDDGCGFDSHEFLQPAPSFDSHIGLMIMQERAARIKATVEIQSVKSLGTKIQFVLSEGNRS